MNSTHQDILTIGVLGVTIAFDIEILIRIAMHFPDWRAFFAKGQNWLDLMLALGSSLMRFYPVISKIRRMKPLLLSVFGDMYGLANMTLFLLLVNFLAALAALQLLQGDLTADDNMTFRQIYTSFLAVYQISSSDNWMAVLYNSADTESGLGQTAIICFFSAWFFFAIFIVIDGNFNIAEESKRVRQTDDYSATHQPQRVKATWKALVQDYGLPGMERMSSKRKVDGKRSGSEHVTSKSLSVLQQLFIGATSKELLASFGHNVAAAEEMNDALHDRRAQTADLCQSVGRPADGEWIFGRPTSATAHTILLTVIGGSVVESITTPIFRRNFYNLYRHNRGSWFNLSEAVSGLMLAIELIINIIAGGFLFTPNAYVCSIWNVLDFAIMACIVVNVTTRLIFIRGLSRFTRAFKVLRALRLITLVEKMQATFESLVLSGASRIFDAAMLAIVYMIPYAVWGLNIFAGLMNECNDSNSTGISDCIYGYENDVVGGHDNLAFTFLVPLFEAHMTLTLMDLNEDALRLVIANLDKKSSARLAQTCCSMSEEALNGLWATVEWSDVLCMARSLVVVEEVANASSWGQTGQGGWGVPGNVTPTNTDRVDPVELSAYLRITFYTLRVRHLFDDLQGRDHGQLSRRLIRTSHGARPLFADLVSFNGDLNSEVFQLNVFGKGIKRLALRVDTPGHSITRGAFLTHFSRSYPALNNVTLTATSSPDNLSFFLDVVVPFIHEQHSLKSLTLPAHVLCHEFLETLGRKTTSLTSLHASFFQNEIDPSSTSSFDSFPWPAEFTAPISVSSGITSLSVASSCDALARFLQTQPEIPSSLTDLSFRYIHDADSRRASIRHLSGVISTECTSLHSLVLNLHANTAQILPYHSHNHPALTWDLLQPISSARSLTRLTIYDTYTMELDDQEVLSIAHALPNIEILYLNPNPSSIGGSRPSLQSVEHCVAHLPHLLELGLCLRIDNDIRIKPVIADDWFARRQRCSLKIVHLGFTQFPSQDIFTVTRQSCRFLTKCLPMFTQIRVGLLEDDTWPIPAPVWNPISLNHHNWVEIWAPLILDLRMSFEEGTAYGAQRVEAVSEIMVDAGSDDGKMGRVRGDNDHEGLEGQDDSTGDDHSVIDKGFTPPATPADVLLVTEGSTSALAGHLNRNEVLRDESPESESITEISSDGAMPYTKGASVSEALWAVVTGKLETAFAGDKAFQEACAHISVLPRNILDQASDDIVSKVMSQLRWALQFAQDITPAPEIYQDSVRFTAQEKGKQRAEVSGPSTSQTPGLGNATSGGSSVLAPFPLFPGWDSFDSEDEGSNSDVGGDRYRPIDVDGEAGGSRVDALDEAKDEDDMDIDDEEATKTKVDLVESESHERISAIMAGVDVNPEPLKAPKEGRKNRTNMEATGENRTANMKKDNVVSDDPPIRNKRKAQAGPSNTSQSSTNKKAKGPVTPKKKK
ncbi:uncharacterized protein STEHIDRAFT_163956 [Stereum hirsutum FP-91666 SS1]|uniref:Ion transport domain-containing protein n=1 Tax=Stereum hirsutum (strain FP-91666) TaxID=721885 RepID=R7RWL2_STEHR|nr:uncharacterized protein STEHIDRAFT_163956 [Stereum hirsutum FP-91666 SS1]EIM79195.1 hypothetical protein STEHIDRAFT_163956 [Stereum hirsutum FP-91666 SS1]